MSIVTERAPEREALSESDGRRPVAERVGEKVSVAVLLTTDAVGLRDKDPERDPEVVAEAEAVRALLGDGSPPCDAVTLALAVELEQELELLDWLGDALPELDPDAAALTVMTLADALRDAMEAEAVAVRHTDEVLLGSDVAVDEADRRLVADEDAPLDAVNADGDAMLRLGLGLLSELSEAVSEGIAGLDAVGVMVRVSVADEDPESHDADAEVLGVADKDARDTEPRGELDTDEQPLCDCDGRALVETERHGVGLRLLKRMVRVMHAVALKLLSVMLGAAEEEAVSDTVTLKNADALRDVDGEPLNDGMLADAATLRVPHEIKVTAGLVEKRLDAQEVLDAEGLRLADTLCETESDEEKELCCDTLRTDGDALELDVIINDGVTLSVVQEESVLVPQTDAHRETAGDTEAVLEGVDDVVNVPHAVAVNDPVTHAVADTVGVGESDAEIVLEVIMVIDEQLEGVNVMDRDCVGDKEDVSVEHDVPD